jgi:hypothetical protein
MELGSFRLLHCVSIELVNPLKCSLDGLWRRMRVAPAHGNAGETGQLHDCKCICSGAVEPNQKCISPRVKGEIRRKTEATSPFPALDHPQDHAPCYARAEQRRLNLAPDASKYLRMEQEKGDASAKWCVERLIIFSSHFL